MSKKNLYKAMFEVKKELGHTLVADAQGQYGAYAPLETVMAAIEPLLIKNGLLLIQGPMVVNDQPILTTQLVHVETEESDSWFQKLVTDKPGPQGVGAAETYARRRNLMAIFGLAIGEDDPDAAKQHKEPAHRQLPSMADIARAKNQPKSNMTPLESKVIQVGKKFKGMRYGQCNIEELDNYASWLRRKAAEDNKDMSRDALEFCDDVEQLKQMLTGFAPMDNNVPF